MSASAEGARTARYHLAVLATVILPLIGAIANVVEFVRSLRRHEWDWALGHFVAISVAATLPAIIYFQLANPTLG
jgi:hypothetical protein